MTVSTTLDRQYFPADGFNKNFPFNFRFFDNSQIFVFLIDEQGNPTGKTLNVDYTLSGAMAAGGGTVVFSVAPAIKMRVLIRRILPQTQPTSIRNQGAFFPAIHEDVFDRLTMLVQQAIADTANSLQLTISGDKWDFRGNKGINAANPTDPQDVATLQWAVNYVSGILETGKGPINNAENIVYVNGDKVATSVQNGIIRQFSYISNLRLRAGVLDREQASVVSYDASTPGEGGGRFYWDSSSVETETENIIAVTGTQIGRWKRIYGYESSPQPTLPIFVEQFLTGFFGRGMLEAETPFVSTEQSLTASSLAGTQIITVASTSGYEVGGGLVIKYPSGKYRPHFIKGKTATTLTVIPTLYEGLSSSDMVARTWFDEAHPGRFYMRYLAQRVAGITEMRGALTTSARTLFTQLDSNPTTGADLLIATGSAVVSYFDETNEGGGGLIGNPVQRNIGRTAFVVITAANDGAETSFFSVGNSTAYSFRGVISTQSASSTVTITSIDSNGKSVIVGIIHPSLNNTVPQYFDFSFKIMGGANKFKLKLTSSTAGDRLVIDQLEVFDSPPLTGQVFTKQRKTIVVLGDSWVAGYLDGSIQREPITQQLAIELPYAKIINAGHGGDKVQDLLARFDAEVAPFNPDYVVINTGTNDAANPASGVFYPNSVDFFRLRYFELISKVIAIGARPIIIGVPALAEVRGASINWEQNNRARTYSRYFYKDFANNLQNVPVDFVYASSGDASTGWVKYTDGSVEFWKTVSVNMTVTTAQTITIPAGASPIGGVRADATLIGLGSATTLTAWASSVLRWDGSNWIVTITTVGTVTSESVIFGGKGRWK